jgi:competence protein ComEC
MFKIVVALYHEVVIKERVRLLVLVCVGATCMMVWLAPSLPTALFTKQCACLSVSFLSVGQGDAILIVTPDGFEALIDGGPDRSVLRALGKERSFFDRHLDLVVATHPDSDHVGGLVDVFERYSVGTILETTNAKETPAAVAYATAAGEENTTSISGEAGQVITLGGMTKLRVLSPAGDESQWESNTASVVLRVEYGSTSVMLTGDAPAEIEAYLVKTYPEFLASDVLKLGHHGSKTSTSDNFLQAVNPRFAVVSAAVGNRYGHPHQEVMSRLFARNIETSHTGTDGTVTFFLDGSRVWRE